MNSSTNLCRKETIPVRVGVVDRVPLTIEVFVQAQRVFVIASIAIHRPEPAGAGIQIAGAIVVKAKVRIKLLAGVEIGRLRHSVRRNQIAVGVIRKGVDKDPAAVVKRPRGTVSVSDKVIGCGLRAESYLADQAQTVVVDPVEG